MAAERTDRRGGQAGKAGRVEERRMGKWAFFLFRVWFKPPSLPLHVSIFFGCSSCCSGYSRVICQRVGRTEKAGETNLRVSSAYVKNPPWNGVEATDGLFCSNPRAHLSIEVADAEADTVGKETGRTLGHVGEGGDLIHTSEF